MREVKKLTPEFFSTKYLYLIDGHKRRNFLLGKLQVNLSSATGLFLYPMKASENVWFYDIFRGYTKKNNGVKWVNMPQNEIINSPIT